MLVLSRKKDESIKIGDDVTITVVSIKGNTVRLGIDAPREIIILRGELKPLADGSSGIDSVVIESRVDKPADVEDMGDSKVA